MSIAQRKRSLLAAILLSLSLVMALIGTVSAHAKVLSATPGINTTITKAPTNVTVQCAENVNPDPKKSNLFVYGPAGELISQGNAKVSLTNPKEISVPIKGDEKGSYVVRWITASAEDGDPDEGAFVFTVNPAGITTTLPITQPVQTQPVNTGVSPVLTIGAAVLALMVGLFAGAAFGRRSVRPSLAEMRKEVAEHPVPTDTPVQ